MRIALVGDIALLGSYSIINNSKLVGSQSVMGDVRSYLRAFDFVVGNLESPFSIAKKPNGAKSAYLYTDTVNIEILKELNISIVTLANNHIFDYGEEGYETTKKVLVEAGIQFFGSEGKVVECRKDNNKLLFSGYCCYSTNPLKLAEKQGGYGINKYNVQEVKSFMKKADEDGYLNIVAAHVGLEHVNYPSLDHVRAARQLAEVCPYIYYGHHPHVIQGVEEYKGSLIAHSLGNFCFDDIYTDKNQEDPLVKLTEQNRTGIILELTIENNKVMEWKEQLIYIGKDGSINFMSDDNRTLDSYNIAVRNCENNPNYKTERDKLINDRIKDRKLKRDIKWVLQRLRPRYVRLMIDMNRNAKLYAENVKKHIA